MLKSLKACFRWGAAVEPGKYSGLPLPANPMAKLKGPTVPLRAPGEVEPLKVSRFLR